ncbi:hypothetical protein LCGC14_2261920, partial [marine sediment metagenome]
PGSGREVSPAHCSGANKAGIFGDFVTDSSLLEEGWRGALSEDLIPLQGHTEEGT